MTEEIEFYIGGGNVFADLELPDAEELQLKSILAVEIRLAIKAQHLTRLQAASKLGISKEEFAALLDGTSFHYSVGQLVGHLHCLGRDVTLSATVRERLPKAKDHAQEVDQKAIAV